MGRYLYDGWGPYVSVASRRRQAVREIIRMKEGGRVVSPVEIKGRKIAVTFWGHAWCRNLESYSDYSNRLPRGRTYVRNGSVIDLQIEAGRVRSLVSGSEIYDVDVEIKPLAKRRWAGIKGQCAGQIDSLVELLRGSISRGVMEIVTRQGEGLFPSPREISLSCSCPDWATMCKHVAATLYGVGARLDRAPDLLFTLRGVDPAEMVEAAVDQPSPGGKARRGRVLESGHLSSVFGIDIEMGEGSAQGAPSRARRGRRAVRGKKKAGTRRAVPKTKGAKPKKTAAKRASAGATRRNNKKKKKKKTAADATSKKKRPTGRARTSRKSKKAGARRAPPEKQAARKKTSSRGDARATTKPSAGRGARARSTSRGPSRGRS